MIHLINKLDVGDIGLKKRKTEKTGHLEFRMPKAPKSKKVASKTSKTPLLTGRSINEDIEHEISEKTLPNLHEDFVRDRIIKNIQLEALNSNKIITLPIPPKPKSRRKLNKKSKLNESQQMLKMK
jgi:hypothetical protein